MARRTSLGALTSAQLNARAGGGESRMSDVGMLKSSRLSMDPASNRRLSVGGVPPLAQPRYFPSPYTLVVIFLILFSLEKAVLLVAQVA